MFSNISMLADIFIGLLFSAFASLFLIWSFNRLPSSWVQDYDFHQTSAEFSKKTLPIYKAFIPLFSVVSISLPFLVYNIASPIQSAVDLTVFLILIHVSVSDIFYCIIPDQHIAAIFIISVVRGLFYDLTSFFYGMAAGFFPFFILLLIAALLKKDAPVGFGDIKLLGALGSYTGVSSIINVYVFSSLFSGAFSVLLFLRCIFSNKRPIVNYIPFAPFITVSYIFCFMA